MTTSTKDLIFGLEKESIRLDRQWESGFSRLTKAAAQRLRELDKPDCVWTSTKVAEIDCFQPACTKSVMYFDLEKKQFCPNCGGAVKSGGTPNE